MWIKLITDMDVLCFPFTDEILGYMFNPLIESIRLYLQFAFANLHLAYIEYHINKVFHSLRLTVDRFYWQILCIFGRKGFQHPVKWCVY